MPDAHSSTENVRAAALTICLVVASPAAADVNVIATYEARLLIKIADLRTDTVVGPTGYRLGARLTTIGALGVIKPSTLLVQADGVTRDGAPVPTVYIQTEKGKRRVTRFNGGGGWKSLADPLTQLMRAAMQPGTPCLGATPIYDGRQRYDLVLSPAGGGGFFGAATGLGLQRPVSCRLGFRPISGFSSSPKTSPFLRGDPVATFGFSPAAQVWLLTDISVPTVAGTGHIALTSAHITGSRPAYANATPPQIRAPKRRR